ncbi:TetR/AcrR family transcriptional regulator [Methanoregula formicica]|uniref:Transcriptional regulator n=1 Tax=Methanoregula formicica (strain DSM 22288 / NBRC 105244 / SMSP) TaxID=593750 RepID=L0H9X7_METFS|nr:TetR/AcrR family transcriptional regulator [Methanoregula formicica]AGB01552.1 transcriptional regulator [Methanoregula formicica SMSP]
MPRINAEYRDEAKRKIIAAALDIAATEGWERITLDAIAQKVGVTKGAFYSYYSNSTDLMQEVFLAVIRTIRDQLLDSLSGDPDIHSALDSASDFLFLQAKPMMPVFIQAIASSITRDTAFRKNVNQLIDENSVLIVAAMSRYQKTGQIPDDVDISSAVRAIYGMSMGLVMMTHVLGRDAREGKQAWVEAAERVLKINTEENR